MCGNHNHMYRHCQCGSNIIYTMNYPNQMCVQYYTKTECQVTECQVDQVLSGDRVPSVTECQVDRVPSGQSAKWLSAKCDWVPSAKCDWVPIALC